MFHDILSLIWTFVPVGLANTGPVIAHNLPFLRRFTFPLDFHKQLRGKRIFGDHKTIRGIIAAMVVGLLAGGLQMLLANLFPALQDYSLGIDYSSAETLFIGLCMGLGAILGDAIKSFFKRQMNIAPGKSWVPFDQVDFVVGGLIASLPFFTMPNRFYLLAIGLALILHPLFNIIAWLLKLQDKPY